MTDTSALRAKLDLGRVIRDTFLVVRRQAVLLFGVTLVLSLLPLIALQYYARGVETTAASNPTAALALFASPVYWGLALVSALLGCLAYGFQLRIALSELEGTPATVDEAVQVGLKRLLPILGVSILMSLGIGFGMLLLIVPGIILALMWSVALPSVVERGGVFASFGHSRDLTRGNRWRIFALVLIVAVVILVAQSILMVLVGGAGNSGTPMFAVVVSSIYSWLMSVLSVVGLAALYIQLRELKGGRGERVAQVFS